MKTAKAATTMKQEKMNPTKKVNQKKTTKKKKKRKKLRMTTTQVDAHKTQQDRDQNESGNTQPNHDGDVDNADSLGHCRDNDVAGASEHAHRHCAPKSNCAQTTDCDDHERVIVRDDTMQVDAAKTTATTRTKQRQADGID
jgi:hypothetical protein